MAAAPGAPPHIFTPAEALPLSCRTEARFLLTGVAVRDAYRASSAILRHANRKCRSADSDTVGDTVGVP